jgi:hypothetical protein
MRTSNESPEKPVVKVHLSSGTTYNFYMVNCEQAWRSGS